MVNLMARVRVDVNDAAVQSYIRAGGEVNNLIRDVVYDTRDFSQAFVANGHVRSGRLLKGIQAAQPSPSGPWSETGRVTSSARHTRYFHDGTTGPITGNPHLVVPRHRGVAHTNRAYSGAGAQLLGEFGKGKSKTKGVFRPNSVRGQAAKPFLPISLRRAMVKHGLW